VQFGYLHLYGITPDNNLGQIHEFSVNHVDYYRTATGQSGATLHMEECIISNPESQPPAPPCFASTYRVSDGAAVGQTDTFLADQGWTVESGNISIYTTPITSAATTPVAMNVAGNVIVQYHSDPTVMGVFRFEVRTNASGSLQFGYYQTTGLTDKWPSKASLATVDKVRFFKAASGAPAAEFSGQECGFPVLNQSAPCGPYHVIVTDGASIGQPDTFCGNPITRPSDLSVCTYVFDVSDGDISIYPTTSQNAQ